MYNVTNIATDDTSQAITSFHFFDYFGLAQLPTSEALLGHLSLSLSGIDKNGVKKLNRTKNG